MKTKLSKCLAQFGMSMAIALLCSSSGWAALQIADRPTNDPPPPPNMLFTPSVEYPTMVEVAHKDDTYAPSKEYLGYFDPNKCYTYNSGQGYFEPSSLAGANHSCSGTWSGNALNYATMGGMDTFRWALTGGSRLIDTASTTTSQGITVLRRSYQISGKLLNRKIPSPSGEVSPNSSNTGTQMKVGSTSYNVHVRVCDVTKGLEDNCAAYKNATTGAVTYKPVGLIQRYQSKIRFGIFSYLLNRNSSGTNWDGTTTSYNWGYDNESGCMAETKYGGRCWTKRDNTDPYEMDGAVLRARLKNVGPLTWENKNNSNVEWDPATGVFIKNPDADDASSSYGGAVSKSGVINYLNDYGFDAKNYEQWDSPSEMYAEALRYLMHRSPTESYYKWTKTKTGIQPGEGFPVITDWWKNGHDSILSYCQRTAIVGIGDVNTHREQNLGDLSSIAQTWMSNMTESGMSVANMSWNTPSENAGPSGARPVPPPTNYFGTNQIAGLAYYAHKNDLRADLTAGKDKKVTVDTYWVDVLENPSNAARAEIISTKEYVHRNQYWLAAKYGGMDDSGNWNKKGRKYEGLNGVKYDIPDNYFPASDPRTMVEALGEIFSEVGIETPGTGAGAGWVSNGNDGDVTDYYLTRYSPVDWSGALDAYGFNGFNPDGSMKPSTPLWKAAEKIDGQNWDTGRRIVTYARQSDGSYKGVPFRLGQLTNTQKSALGSDDPTRQAVLNYLRGDKGSEALPGYRERKTLLGDIVHSKPTEVGPPSAGYSDAKNPGYSKFKEKHKSRDKVVYVGANDGMLHAIKGIGTLNEGTELWAYIPSFLFEGPDNPKDPEVSGLRALTRSTYSHHYYVDATPMVRDVDFHHTKKPGGSLSTSDEDSADWRTILVGGLGKGGKGFFALDVTDATAASEADVAKNKVLWEFPQLENPDPDVLADISDMGFSFGRPLITKTKEWGWVVILTSGYNNDSGKGVLYVLNAKTGEKLARVETGAGTTTEEAGFAQVSGYTQAYADYTTDEVYGGDLLGSLWRFDLKGSSIPAPDKIAEFQNGGNVQPITAAPIIEIIEDASSPVNESRWVAVGTGQWMSTSDITGGPGAQQQTMYVIRDGDINAPRISSAETLHRGDLTQLSTSSLTGTGLNPPPDKGWYYDMGGSIGLSMERVTFSASFVPNTLVWTGIIPRDVQDQCNIEVPKGKSRIYAVDMATGKTKLSKGAPNGYYEVDALAVGQDIVQSDDEFKVVVTTSEGEIKTPPDNVGTIAAGGLSRNGVINWRSVE